MTERRQLITRQWRPAGEPARGADDFAEIPHLAITATPPTSPTPAARQQPDHREIGARLENWARWATESERQIGSSATAKMIDRAKLEAGIVEPRTNERRAVDDADAVLLERAMRQLTTQHRMLLWWCYIRQAWPEVVCRKMSIAHKPATVFVEQFSLAQAAVERLVQHST